MDVETAGPKLCPDLSHTAPAVAKGPVTHHTYILCLLTDIVAVGLGTEWFDLTVTLKQISREVKKYLYPAAKQMDTS